MKARDERTFDIDGHEMTGYQASQAMRRIETAVREQKGIKAMAQASGDKLAVRECNERIKRYQHKYKEISDITGIAQDKKRMTLTGADKIKSTSTPNKVKTVDNSANNGTIKAEQLKRIPQVPSSTITKKIEVGEYGTKLSKQHYQKHINGTPQYNQYLSTRIAKGGNPQSILTISEQEAQEIILTKSGTGIVRVSRNGIPKPQEDITCDKIIGKYYGGGKYHDTKKATIHYGKQRSHIVPIKGDNYD